MKKKQRIIYLGTILLLLFSSLLLGQESEAFSTNSELWQKEANKCDFNIDQKVQEVQENQALREDSSFDPTSLGQSLTVFAYIFIAIILILVVLAIVRSGAFKGNRSVKGKGEWLERLENIEENLEDKDLEYFIKQALKEHAWDVALRLQYLKAIQVLNKAKFIIWKKQKTNGQYLRELQGEAVGIDFKKATYIFEYVWYSNDQFSPSGLKKYYKEMEQNVAAIIQETQKIAPNE